MTKSNLQNLTSRKVLVRNTFYSLIGQAAPLLIAVFSIPLLIKGLGTDRFGILTLAWMVISYFSLFDLGLGRALTQLVAEKLGQGNNEESVSSLVWTASLLMVILGLLGTFIFALISPWLVYRVIKIPVELQSETLYAFYILSLSIPIVTSTAGIVGVLSALQRFDLINFVRIPLGIFIFIGPLLVLPFSKNLIFVIGVLLAGRLLAWLVYLWLCLRSMPELRNKIKFKRSLLTQLLGFGGWMTLSNIIGPLMVYLDRFLIGGLISVTAVAYYTTPYELATKLWVIPGALVSVLFPAFSTSFIQEPARAKQLFNRGVKYIFLILFPITLVIVNFASEGLNLWLDQDFAKNSTLVLQCLAIGVFINSLAHVPFALVQGIGRPDLTAKLHFIELPLYLILLWQFTSRWGISGAAFAWVIRVTIDTIFLFYIAHSLMPNKISTIGYIGLSTGICLLMLPIVNLKLELFTKVALILLLLVGFVVSSWLFFLDNEERKLIKKQLKLA